MGTLKKAFRVFFLLLCISTFWISYCYGVMSKEIFIWVSRHMNIEYAENMPEVKYVEKKMLQQIFEQYSQRSLEKWRNAHGENKARIIMSSYMDRLKGMFNPETGVIYVATHLSSCEQHAVLAHEFTHYFQHLRDGPISLGGYYAEDQRLFREMEAYQMATKFKRINCDGQGHIKSDLAMWYSP